MQYPYAQSGTNSILYSTIAAIYHQNNYYNMDNTIHINMMNCSYITGSESFRGSYLIQRHSEKCNLLLVKKEEKNKSITASVNKYILLHR
jgi:hypothetical protein